MTETIRVGRGSVEISRPEKILFPADGITKLDLGRYYEAVAPKMLPLVRGRPLALERFPNGIRGHAFYQKDVSKQRLPGWVKTVTVRKEGGSLIQVVCENAETIVWLADQAVITPHVWLSRADEPDNPDDLIFDLDPGKDFEQARRAALLVRRVLDELGLPSKVKTSGGGGLHVHVSLDRRADFQQVRSFARDLASLLASEHPDQLTTDHRKANRKGRLYLDIMRNGYGQHAVAPYGVRSRDGAPVATPVDWSEVEEKSLRPDRFTLRTVPRRLERDGDPWSAIRKRGRSIGPSRKRLDQMRNDAGA